MPLTAQEKTKGTADLKAAGCPDDQVGQLLALPQATGPWLQIVFALVAKYGPGILADLLQLLKPAP